MLLVSNSWLLACATFFLKELILLERQAGAPAFPKAFLFH
jgi:hypothetical protein